MKKGNISLSVKSTLVIAQTCWELETACRIKGFHTQLYRNFKEHHHAGLLERKFGAKYLKNMRNKVCSIASMNNSFKRHARGIPGNLFIKFPGETLGNLRGLEGQQI